MLTQDQKLIDLLNLDSFGEFVDSQNPHLEYQYNDNGYNHLIFGGTSERSPGCALVRYFRHHGFEKVCVSPVHVYPNFKEAPNHTIDLPQELNDVVRHTTISDHSIAYRTFGALSQAIKERQATKKKLEAINS